SGRGAESRRAANRAIEILEPLGPGPELAWAYAQQGALMTAAHNPAAHTFANKALAQAEKTGPPGALATALYCTGVMRALDRDPAGEELIRRALQISLEAGLDEESTFAYLNLADVARHDLNLGAAVNRYREALQFCQDREIHMGVLGA